MLALSICFTQTSWSAGRIFAMSKSRLLYYYQRIVWFPQHRIRWNTWCTGFHWESAFVREMPNLSLNVQHGSSHLRTSHVSRMNDSCLTRDMTHTWHDSHVTWLICVCHLTHSCMSRFVSCMYRIRVKSQSNFFYLYLWSIEGTDSWCDFK